MRAASLTPLSRLGVVAQNGQPSPSRPLRLLRSPTSRRAAVVGLCISCVALDVRACSPECRQVSTYHVIAQGGHIYESLTNGTADFAPERILLVLTNGWQRSEVLPPDLHARVRGHGGRSCCTQQALQRGPGALSHKQLARDGTPPSRDAPPQAMHWHGPQISGHRRPQESPHSARHVLLILHHVQLCFPPTLIGHGGHKGPVAQSTRHGSRRCTCEGGWGARAELLETRREHTPHALEDLLAEPQSLQAGRVSQTAI